MLSTMNYFAESSSGSGLGAFQISWKGLIFQLITFLLVLLVFKRWILPPINKTLEERRRVVEKSLSDAKASEEALRTAEEKVDAILKKARTQADGALADAQTRAEEVIAKAETAAAERAERIIKETEGNLQQERQKLRDELRKELGELIVVTTEKVLRQKINERQDRELIERSLKELS